MTNGDKVNHATADRIEEILQAAVRQGQAPGVVAVARGDAVHVTAAMERELSSFGPPQPATTPGAGRLDGPAG